MMNGLLKMPLFIPIAPSISVSMMAEVPMTMLSSDRSLSWMVSAYSAVYFSVSSQYISRKTFALMAGGKPTTIVYRPVSFASPQSSSILVDTITVLLQLLETSTERPAGILITSFGGSAWCAIPLMTSLSGLTQSLS